MKICPSCLAAWSVFPSPVARTFFRLQRFLPSRSEGETPGNKVHAWCSSWNLPDAVHRAWNSATRDLECQICPTLLILLSMDAAPSARVCDCFTISQAGAITARKRFRETVISMPSLDILTQVVVATRDCFVCHASIKRGRCAAEKPRKLRVRKSDSLPG